MSKDISKFYTPIKSNQLLKDRFYDCPQILDLISKMTVTGRCVFAALCDGYKVSTVGYSVPADIRINRASAVIHFLRELNLPIETAYSQALSDAGNETRQAVFYIERSTVLRLTKNPNKVINECKQMREESRLVKSKKDIKRIFNEYGKEGIMDLINEIELNKSGK